MTELMDRAKALKEAFEGDETFAAKFKKAINDRSVDTAIDLAAAKGIELFPEDFTLPDAAAIEGKELDDAELEAVAGGYSWDEFVGDVGCVVFALLATMF